MQKIALIIPCYNESERLSSAFYFSLLDFLPELSFFLINDRSNDHTLQKLSEMKLRYPERINIISLSKRSGKAEAVRQGILASLKMNQFDYIGFKDADFSVSVEELIRLYKILLISKKSCIVGSRIRKIGSQINRNEWRHFGGRVVGTIAGFITHLEVYDTQCGVKIFNRELADQIFSEPFKTKWLFDIEIFSRIKTIYKNLFDVCIEEPLRRWDEVKGSKLKWFSFLRIIRELYLLYKYYKN